MQLKILIVDDEKAIRTVLKRTMERNGFSVLEASSGGEALKIIRNFKPALMVLDLNLGDISGMDVCAAIKSDPKISYLPIIVLTGGDAEGRNIFCLDQGVDDYMTKPFDLKEVVSRVKAVLRRGNFSGSTLQNIIKRKGVSIDVGRQTVSFEDRVVENLTSKEFGIFSLLVQNSPDLLRRNFLAKKMWDTGTQVVHERTIDVHIRRIRMKLGHPTLDRLRSISGKGYRFV